MVHGDLGEEVVVESPAVPGYGDEVFLQSVQYFVTEVSWSYSYPYSASCATVSVYLSSRRLRKGPA